MIALAYLSARLLVFAWTTVKKILKVIVKSSLGGELQCIVQEVSDRLFQVTAMRFVPHVIVPHPCSPTGDLCTQENQAESQDVTNELRSYNRQVGSVGE